MEISQRGNIYSALRNDLAVQSPTVVMAMVATVMAVTVMLVMVMVVMLLMVAMVLMAAT
jgi:hypothetical protein